MTLRLLVLPPEELDGEGGPPTALLPLAFDAPRAFDEQELRKLSPAAEVHRALIGVDEAALGIWGIAQSGPRWLQASYGGRAKEPPMPPCLVVRVVRPGHLIVSAGSRLVAELRGGKLSDFALDVFQSQWLPTLFKDARAAAVSEQSALDPAVAGPLSSHVAQQMVKRVVATMRSAHHGGTLLVLPQGCNAGRYLQTTYPFRDTAARRRFRVLVHQILEAVGRRAEAKHVSAAVELYRADATDPKLAELDEGLFEISNLIAALACVDGAVVLTKRFELLGFGAEIAGNLPTVTEVRRALDAEGERFATEVVDAVGTRHRSAYRLCAAVPGAVAVVVSQDGGVRFVTHRDDAVMYWDHGPGDG